MKLLKETAEQRRERIGLWKTTATKVKKEKTAYTRAEKHKKRSFQNDGAPLFFPKRFVPGLINHTG